MMQVAGACNRPPLSSDDNPLDLCVDLKKCLHFITLVIDASFHFAVIMGSFVRMDEPLVFSLWAHWPRHNESKNMFRDKTWLHSS